MVHVKNFRADCIKPVEIRGTTVCHKWKRYNVRMCVWGGKRDYAIEDDLANYNEKWLTLTEEQFDEHFQVVPNKLKVEFAAHFETDGDYTVERTDEMENLTHIKSMYARDNNVHAEYKADWDSDCEGIDFHLKVEGNADNCLAITREFLEELMCSIRTHRHYILINLLNKLNGMYEALVKTKSKDLNLYDEMSGNYSGTEMALSVSEIEENDAPTQESEEIAQEPDAGVEEVVYARWIYENDEWICSHCKEEALQKVEYSRGCYMGCETVHSKRCPNCGAHMENWGDNT